MIASIMQLYSRRVVLASASPRRRALLESACYDVEVRVPRIDEKWPGGSTEEGSIILARRKLAVLGESPELALAADTLVLLGEEQLGKPKDREEAQAMLRALSGREHQVVTGYCVSRAERQCEAAVFTRVWFRQLSGAEINRYVDSGEPFDKAGAYAIQGLAGAFVDRVEGSYTNVIGLPLAEVLVAMRSLS